MASLIISMSVGGSIGTILGFLKDPLMNKVLAFSLKKNYELAINLFKEIDYDMSQIEKAYFDPQKTLSADNYKKVESILKNFEKS